MQRIGLTDEKNEEYLKYELVFHPKYLFSENLRERKRNILLMERLVKCVAK